MNENDADQTKNAQACLCCLQQKEISQAIAHMLNDTYTPRVVISDECKKKQ